MFDRGPCFVLRESTVKIEVYNFAWHCLKFWNIVVIKTDGYYFLHIKYYWLRKTAFNYILFYSWVIGFQQTDGIYSIVEWQLSKRLYYFVSTCRLKLLLYLTWSCYGYVLCTTVVCAGSHHQHKRQCVSPRTSQLRRREQYWYLRGAIHKLTADE